MRANIYNDELTDETKLVTKKKGDGIYYGVRVYLESPYELDEEDRSAITFWVGPDQPNKEGGLAADFHLIARMLDGLYDRMQQAREMAWAEWENDTPPPADWPR